MDVIAFPPDPLAAEVAFIVIGLEQFDGGFMVDLALADRYECVFVIFSYAVMNVHVLDPWFEDFVGLGHC